MSLEEVLDAAAAGPPTSWPAPVHDNPNLTLTFVELLEFRQSDSQSERLSWDAQGWTGNDDHKFWWKTEGDLDVDGSSEGELDVQALYARPLDAFWYAQAGIRYDREWDGDDARNRASLVLGLQGLAPYKFELEPTLLLTDDGDFLGQLTASYDVYLTQQIALQPRVECSVASRDVPEYALAAGFNDIALEMRMRYEVEREFAPYVGIRYWTLLGETADLGRTLESATDDLELVFGVRIAF